MCWTMPVAINAGSNFVRVLPLQCAALRQRSARRMDRTRRSDSCRVILVGIYESFFRETAVRRRDRDDQVFPDRNPFGYR